MITIQLNNDLMNQDIIKAIKAILKTQPKEHYFISRTNALNAEINKLEKDYKEGKIKGYKSAEQMHKAIFDE